MNVIHLTGGHWYQRFLSDQLRLAQVDIPPVEFPWGCYLPGCLEQIVALNPDVLHIHWPESFSRHLVSGLFPRLSRRLYLCAMNSDQEWGRWLYETYAALKAIRKHGIAVVWTMHNLRPHDADPACLDAYDLLYQSIASVTNGVIHHSKWGQAEARAEYAWPVALKEKVISFPCFPDLAPEQMSRHEARRQLQVPESEWMVLCVGDIKSRKSLSWIVQGVKACLEFPCRLHLVGSGEPDQIRQLLDAGDEAVHYAGALDQAALSLYARAADVLVAAPHPKQLTTGAPHVSQSFLLPMITTDSPYVREILGDHAIYCDPNADQLRNRLADARQADSDPAWRSDWRMALAATRTAHEALSVARATRDFYGEVCGV